MTDTTFRQDWQTWQRERFAAATAPHGPAALTLTYWVTPGRTHQIPAVAGTWQAGEEGTGIRASGLASSGYLLPGGGSVDDTVLLSPGGTTELIAEDRRLRLFERDGTFALRIFDPNAGGRTGLEAIEAFVPDETWRLAAVFDPHEEQREIELVDGYQRTVGVSGTLRFTVDGEERRLTATRRPDALSIVFGDTTNGAESYGFRFLTTGLPDDEGRVVLDFNRAFLPPCAFSDQFVCPLPTPENRLPFAIRAGERLTRLAPPSTQG